MTTASKRIPSVLVILRREYLEITEGNFCAAKLIEYFLHWTKWKLSTHRTDWIYQPLKNIYADLMGEHSLHVIRRAIALLEEIGILSKRNNPSNGQDKTYQYRLNLSVLNQRLEYRECKNEHSQFNVEQYQQISNLEISDPQQQPAAVEQEFSQIPWDTLKAQVEKEQSQLMADLNDLNPALRTESQDQDLDQSHAAEEGEVVENDTDFDVKCNTVIQSGIRLNDTIKKLLQQFSLAQVKSAIAYYQQRKTMAQIKNPAGWLIECLRGKWWLNDDPGVPLGFNEWYLEAKRQRLVQASMMVDGVLLVCMADGEWLSYESALS